MRERHLYAQRSHCGIVQPGTKTEAGTGHGRTKEGTDGIREQRQGLSRKGAAVNILRGTA